MEGSTSPNFTATLELRCKKWRLSKRKLFFSRSQPLSSRRVESTSKPSILAEVIRWRKLLIYSPRKFQALMM